MADEKTVVDNQTAPEADGHSIVPNAGQVAQTPTTKAEPAQNDTDQSTPAPKGETTEQPDFDVRKSYDELRKQFTKVTQDYSRDRRVWNQTLSELQSMKQAQASLAEAVSKATEKPVSPEQVMRDLQTHGLKALDPYFEKKFGGVQKQLQDAYSEQANKALLLEAKLEKLNRRLDPERFPDFEKLEPLMQEIADAEDCPIDWNQPTSAIYDALYKLARARSSEDAVKAAEQFGRKSAEDAARKEAATAVPGGGKGGVPPTDLKDMSAAQLRELFISKGMISEE